MTYYTYENVTGSVTIIQPRDGRLLSFTENPENTDWQAYQAWLAEGNTPEPWPPAE